MILEMVRLLNLLKLTDRPLTEEEVILKMELVVYLSNWVKVQNRKQQDAAIDTTDKG